VIIGVIMSCVERKHTKVFVRTKGIISTLQWSGGLLSVPYFCKSATCLWSGMA